jgi:hypothetical protein
MEAVRINCLLMISQIDSTKANGVTVKLKFIAVHCAGQLKQKQTPWPLVRERTIPTDRPPLVDEI